MVFFVKIGIKIPYLNFVLHKFLTCDILKLDGKQF